MIASRGFGDDEAGQELHDNERLVPEGAMMVIGLGSYVYCACHGCMIDPRNLKQLQSDRCELVRESGRLTFKRRPLDVRAWRLPSAGAQSG